MRTFVINLDKNIERMAFVSGQMQKFGLSYERVSAVFGAALSPLELKCNFSRIRSFLAMGYKLHAGEIGCALSHIGIYRRMISEKIPIALILEDDIIMMPGIVKTIGTIVQNANCCKPQVYLLSAHGVEAVSTHSHIERINGGMCTDGYVITLPAARLIEQANFPVVTTADRWSRWERRYGIEMFRCWPTAVCQDVDSFISDVTPSRIERRTGIMLVIHKAFRCIERILDIIIFMATGK